MNTLATTNLLLDTLVDNYIGIHSHTHCQNDTCDTWQGQYCAERYKATHQEEYIGNQCDISHPTCCTVEQAHIEENEYERQEERQQTCVDRLLTERWTNNCILDDACRCRHLTRLQHICQVLCLLNSEITRNRRVTTLNLTTNYRSRVYITIENDSDALTNILASELCPLGDTVRVHSHRNLCVSTSLCISCTSVRNYRAIEWSLAISTLNLDSVKEELTISQLIALDAPLEANIAWEAVASLRQCEVAVDCNSIGSSSSTYDSTTCICRVQESEQWILLTSETSSSLLSLCLLRNLGSQCRSLGSSLALNLSSNLLVSITICLHSHIGTLQCREQLLTIVGCPELQRCSTLQELTNTLRLLNTRELNQDTVRVWKTLDIWLNNTEVVDTAADDVERSCESVVSLLLQHLNNLVIAHTRLDILAIRRDEKVSEWLAVRSLCISLSQGLDIATCTLTECLVSLCDSSNECRIVLALTCERLNYILNLNLEHHIHTALQVETEVNLLLLALLVSERGQTYIVNCFVLDRIEIILLHRSLLLGRERFCILYGSLLNAFCFKRERELVKTSQTHKDGYPFDYSFALHLS